MRKLVTTNIVGNGVERNKWGARTAQVVLDDTDMCLSAPDSHPPFKWPAIHAAQCCGAFGAIEATEAAVARAKQTEAAAFRSRRARAASAIYWLERDSETARERRSLEG